jgi:hypothetical protein
MVETILKKYYRSNRIKLFTKKGGKFPLLF